MSAPTRVVKKTAKTAIKGNFSNCVAVCAIGVFSFLCCLYISQILSQFIHDTVFLPFFALTFIFLVCPVFLGIIRYFRRLIWGVADSPAEAFFYFQSARFYKRAISFTAIFLLRAVLIGLAVFLPAIMVDVFSSPYIYEAFNMSIPIWTLQLGGLSAFLKVLAILLLTVIILKYHLSAFLFVADDYITASEAMHVSAMISRKSGTNFVILILSIWHYILASVIFVPILFTLPYIICFYTVHARFSVAQYNKTVEELNNNNFNSYNV